jgi:hypothetical protein
MAYIRHRDGEKPTLRPTFDGKGNAVERVVTPGRRLGFTEGESNLETHSCDECAALYTELTGAEPAPA